VSKKEWDGTTERREENRMAMDIINKRLSTIEIAIEGIVVSLKNYHDNGRTYREDMQKDIQKHEETIYGNGRAGLTSLKTDISTMIDDIKSHLISDRWIHGSILMILMTILGWTIFKK